MSHQRGNLACDAQISGFVICRDFPSEARELLVFHKRVSKSRTILNFKLYTSCTLKKSNSKSSERFPRGKRYLNVTHLRHLPDRHTTNENKHVQDRVSWKREPKRGDKRWRSLMPLHVSHVSHLSSDPSLSRLSSTLPLISSSHLTSPINQ